MKQLALFILLAVPALAGAAKPADTPDRPEAAADRQDRIICKRFAQIGSLVETQKECKTKRQWETERNNLSLRDAIGSCSGPGGAAASMSGATCGAGH